MTEIERLTQALEDLRAVMAQAIVQPPPAPPQSFLTALCHFIGEALGEEPTPEDLETLFRRVDSEDSMRRFSASTKRLAGRVEQSLRKEVSL